MNAECDGDCRFEVRRDGGVWYHLSDGTVCRPRDATMMTPRYRLAKVLWEKTNARISWQELVDMAAKERKGSATDLVAEYLALGDAVIKDGWHL